MDVRSTIASSFSWVRRIMATAASRRPSSRPSRLASLSRDTIIAQRTLAHERQTLRLFVGTDLAQPLQCTPCRLVRYLGHDPFLPPMLEKSDPGVQSNHRKTQTVRLVQFDQIDLQDVPERHLRLVFIAHLEAPDRLLPLRRIPGEQVKIQQVNPDRGAQLAVILTAAQLHTQGAGQIEQAPFVPRAIPPYLYFDCVAVALGVARARRSRMI